MSWPTRSKQLLCELRSPIVANTKYYGAAVPVGETWLMKDLRVYNNSGGTISVYLWLKHLGADIPVGQIGVASQAVNVSFGSSMVVEAGDQLGYSCTGAPTSIGIVVSGAKL